MKFFKFNIEGHGAGRYFFKTFYINVESIEDVFVEECNITLRTRGGGVFNLSKEDLNRLLKLVDLDEKEAKIK